MVVFGGSYGIGADVVDLAERHGAQVFSFSRSLTGVRVEDAQAVSDALARHGQGDRADRLRGQHRGRAAHGQARQGRRRHDRRDRGRELPGPGQHRQGRHPYLRETRGHLLLYTSSSYTRGRADYSLYSSTKAAVVNLTQALADEWADVRRAGQLRQSGADQHPDALPRLRGRTGAHPALAARRRPDLTGRAHLRPDRTGDRRSPRRDLHPGRSGIHLGHGPRRDALDASPHVDSPTAIRRIPTLGRSSVHPDVTQHQLINIYLGSTRHSAPTRANTGTRDTVGRCA